MKNNELQDGDENPKVGHQATPLWIKLMWIFGVSWIILYIWFGLKSSPALW